MPLKLCVSVRSHKFRRVGSGQQQNQKSQRNITHTAWSNADKSDNYSFSFNSTMTQALSVWNVPSCWASTIWRKEIQISNFCFLGSVSTGYNIFLHMLLSEELQSAGAYSEVVAVLHPRGGPNICSTLNLVITYIFTKNEPDKSAYHFTDTILCWVQTWIFAVKLVTYTVLLQQLHCPD